jgi:hypothetical protein
LNTTNALPSNLLSVSSAPSSPFSTILWYSHPFVQKSTVPDASRPPRGRSVESLNLPESTWAWKRAPRERREEASESEREGKKEEGERRVEMIQLGK